MLNPLVFYRPGNVIHWSQHLEYFLWPQLVAIRKRKFHFSSVKATSFYTLHIYNLRIWIFMVDNVTNWREILLHKYLNICYFLKLLPGSSKLRKSSSILRCHAYSKIYGNKRTVHKCSQSWCPNKYIRTTPE